MDNQTQEYLNKIDNAMVTQQQYAGFQVFKTAYTDENLDVMAYSFGRFYAEWCRENGYFNGVASHQVNNFQ